jgi:hypothetical protein
MDEEQQVHFEPPRERSESQAPLKINSRNYSSYSFSEPSDLGIASEDSKKKEKVL